MGNKLGLKVNQGSYSVFCWIVSARGAHVIPWTHFKIILKVENCERANLLSLMLSMSQYQINNQHSNQQATIIVIHNGLVARCTQQVHQTRKSLRSLLNIKVHQGLNAKSVWHTFLTKYFPYLNIRFCKLPLCCCCCFYGMIKDNCRDQNSRVVEHSHNSHNRKYYHDIIKSHQQTARRRDNGNGHSI